MIDFRSAFCYLYFNEGQHEYSSFDNDGKLLYTSVTTLLHDYQKDIFTDEFLTSYCNKHNKPKEIVRRCWDIKRDYSGIRGTELHLYIESYFKYGYQFQTNTGIETEIKYFHQFWEQYKQKLNPIENELRICNKGVRIAGTIDFLMQSKSTGKYHIFDWKSNSKFEFNSKEKLLTPFNDLDDCHFIKYSLQLGIYRWILQKQFPDIEMGDNFIVWFNHNNSSFQLIKCRDLSQHIECLMTSIKNLTS
jgi:ATP-dependent exoDNAse (exonuclease V) beta subunit